MLGGHSSRLEELDSPPERKREGQFIFPLLEEYKKQLMRLCKVNDKSSSFAEFSGGGSGGHVRAAVPRCEWALETTDQGHSQRA